MDMFIVNIDAVGRKGCELTRFVLVHGTSRAGRQVESARTTRLRNSLHHVERRGCSILVGS